jgi:Phosphopantetheinyl transferase
MIKVFFTQYSAFEIPPACPLSAYRRAKLSQTNQEQNAKQVTTEFVLLKSLRTVDDDVSIPMNIQTNEYGKPFIPGYPYHFNISHSDDLIICGVSDIEIGVDCQTVDTNSNIEGIIKRFFTPDEQSYVLSGSPSSTPELRTNNLELRTRFTELWTLKESYIKALGTGGATPLESFSVLKSIPGYSLHHNKAGKYHYAICVKSDIFPAELSFEKLS